MQTWWTKVWFSEKNCRGVVVHIACGFRPPPSLGDCPVKDDLPLLGKKTHLCWIPTLCVLHMLCRLSSQQPYRLIWSSSLVSCGKRGPERLSNLLKVTARKIGSQSSNPRLDHLQALVLPLFLCSIPWSLSLSLFLSLSLSLSLSLPPSQSLSLHFSWGNHRVSASA